DVGDDEATRLAARVQTEFEAAGFDVLIDDREARPGVKFADAELIGVPYRLTIGSRSLAQGQVEFTPRGTGEMELLSSATCVEACLERILAGK
ncbi:MAG TPA: proline--tRNA ligase, partial [Acidimicrobiaceae bacterium]|nr:proline--tRNA ligase [Acidimicrobiaceae bacterium]